MKEKKKHGENMSIEIKTKEELLEALQREVSKPANELDAVEVDRLTRLLEQCDEDKHTYTSDYEEFLQRFNARNNTSLTSSAGRKKQVRQMIQKLQISRKRKNGFVVAASILLIVIVYSNMFVMATTNITSSSWITHERDGLVFHIVNCKCEDWKKKAEKEIITESDVEKSTLVKMEPEYCGINDINKLNIMTPDYLPGEYKIQNIGITDLGTYVGMVNISYKLNKDNWISYKIHMNDVESEFEWSINAKEGSTYVDTVEFENFTSYIFRRGNRVEAYFCCDGLVYSVVGSISLEDMYDVLGSVAYHK